MTDNGGHSFTEGSEPIKLTDKEQLEFLREYAKCGIYHNHGYHDDILDYKLKKMNEVIKSLQDLQQQLKEERNKAIHEAIMLVSKYQYDTQVSLINELKALKSDSK